ncbi:MAG TPA: hypothetical protein VGN15_10810, partial [Ktedonobacteraceae bacterium]|nr:hypothetical protein [Ktedonobacteraceae bacterium]
MRGSPISLVGVPNTITGNKTFTGVTTINNQLIVTGEPGAFVTLKLSAASGQTGNLLELYNTSATRVAYFDQAGNFTSTGAVSYASTQVVQGTTGIGFSVKGNASNSSDLQQWQNSSGAVLLGITEAGNLYGGSGLTVGGNLVLTGANGLQIRGDNSTADPGVPWIHSDGSNLTLNPHGSSSVVLCGDIGIQVKFGATGGIIFRIDNSSVDPGLPWMRSDGSSLYIS